MLSADTLGIFKALYNETQFRVLLGSNISETCVIFEVWDTKLKTIC